MKEKIRTLLEEIRQREEEMAKLLKQQEAALSYTVDGTKVKFEKAVKQAQRRMKTGLFAWLADSDLRNVASAPIIYLMIVPFVVLDLAISCYQYLCFPLYRITKVNRKKYIVVDRHHLSYLNSIEKLNCIYCGYISGLLAYSREIVSRTEQYWCPIKHARKIVDANKRYEQFAPFGEAEGLVEHVKIMRAEVTGKDSQPKP